MDINDLTIVLANYNQSLGSSDPSPATVPEPSTLLLVLVGLLTLSVPFRRCMQNDGGPAVSSIRPGNHEFLLSSELPRLSRHHKFRCQCPCRLGW